MPTNDLFALSRKLHEVNDFEAVIVAAREAITQRTPYQQDWIMLVTPGHGELEATGFPTPQDPELLQRIVERQSEPDSATRITNLGSTTEPSRTSKYYRDSAYVRMLFDAQEPIVVPDQRKHPLADQDKVAFYGNRTLIWVPLAHLSTRQGELGVGTFSAQGVVKPTREQLEFIVQVGALVAVVSRRIAAQDENRMLQARLASKERLESLGRLSGEISHDLCNIFVCIIGNIEFIEESIDEDHNARNYVQEHYDATTRATGLFRQLLTFSAGGTTQRSTTNTSKGVTDLAVMLRRLLPRSIDLVLDLTPGSFVHVDSGQWEQLVTNLVLNSRDAMPKGGLSRISTSSQKLTTGQAERLGTDPQKPFVHLAVADEGTGMSQDVLKQIFDPLLHHQGGWKRYWLGNVSGGSCHTPIRRICRRAQRAKHGHHRSHPFAAPERIGSDAGDRLKAYA